LALSAFGRQHDRVPESSALSQARQRAEALAGAGDPDGARALLERAVAVGREHLADGDAELLATMRQLADVQMRADDPMAARRLLEEAIEAGRRLSDTDPLAVLLAHDLAVVAGELANRHVARSNFARVAEFGPSALGVDHPAVVRARAYLASDATPGHTAAPPAAVPVPGPDASPVPAPEAPAPIISALGPAPRPTSVPGPAPRFASAPPSISASPPLPGPPVSGPALVPGSGGATGRSRRSWVPAGVAVVAVTVAVTAIVTRSAGEAGPPVPVQAAPARVTLHDAGSSVTLVWARPANGSVSSFAVTGGPVGEAPRQWGQATADAGSFQVQGLDPGRNYCFAVVASYGPDGAATSPQACTTRASAPSTSLAAGPPSSAPAGPAPSRTATTTAPAAKPTKAATSTTTATSATRTRIVSPAGNSTVTWPFDARFTVSPADVSATGTVLSLSICVAGRCYLDGKVGIFDGVAAPYTVHLGSTRPEGVGVDWQLRLDRIPRGVYDTLVSERDAAIAAGTWGGTSTRMDALNATPVSTLTVTKGG
jgi:hypothetical protein